MPQLSQHDPLDIAITDTEIRLEWLKVMELPVAANDGKVFQYDLVSERLMKSAILGWDVAGLITMPWRLNNNTTVTVTKAQLQVYIDELELNRTLRGFVIDGQYLAYKSSGATRRDIVIWKALHTI